MRARIANFEISEALHDDMIGTLSRAERRVLVAKAVKIEDRLPPCRCVKLLGLHLGELRSDAKSLPLLKVFFHAAVPWADGSHGAFDVVSPSLCIAPTPLAQKLELFVTWFARSWLVDTVIFNGASSVLAEACSVVTEAIDVVLTKVDLSSRRPWRATPPCCVAVCRCRPRKTFR